MMGEKFFSPVKSFFLNVNGLIHICKSNVNERLKENCMKILAFHLQFILTIELYT